MKQKRPFALIAVLFVVAVAATVAYAETPIPNPLPTATPVAATDTSTPETLPTATPLAAVQTPTSERLPTEIPVAAADTSAPEALPTAVPVSGAETPVPEPLPTSAPIVDPSVVVPEFYRLSFWLAILATVVAGALGGIVYELIILQGSLELPHKLTRAEITETPPYAIAEYMYDLGILARIIIGGLAGVIAFLVISPESGFQLLATALVAGSAGTSIFRSMQDRLMATVAQRDAANTRATAGRMAAKVEEASAAFHNLKDKIMKVTASRAGARGIDFEARAAALDPEDLDQVERLLSQAKGIHEGI